MPRVTSRRRPWKQLVFASHPSGEPGTSDIVMGVLGIALLAGFCLIMAANVVDGLTGVTG
ncbi:hypothetical protein [Methylobacterium goesingense]|uniref:Uncharacterized protein n=1 Tax=Methylobacterium goesingense TaxID=243690 RepID=A0ABV2L2C4_9HYPH|nr:hypothetical protein [Methylobacterium goesingense]GJD75599.1 hypothetical protein CFIICLFH_3841 [Methylobacterium goesingense]